MIERTAKSTAAAYRVEVEVSIILLFWYRKIIYDEEETNLKVSSS